MAPTARKKAWASESCPVVPTRRFSPIAPTIAPNTAKPVRSQNSSTYSGSASSTTRSATTSSGRSHERRERRGRVPVRSAGPRLAPGGAERVRSDTCQLLGPEQPRRADQQDDDHHDVRHHLAEPAPQERQLLLVAGGEGLG